MTPLRALLLGESKAGKTCTLLRFLREGFRVCVLDYDGGIDSLLDLMTVDERGTLLERLSWINCTDSLRAQIGKDVPMGYPKSVQALSRWKDAQGRNLGAITTWGTDTILVLDSLTFQGNAILRHVCAINGKTDQLDPGHRDGPDYTMIGRGQELQEQFISMVMSSEVGCHRIVTAHLRPTEEAANPGIAPTKDERTAGAYTVRMYPSTLGRKLAPKVGRYFRAVLLLRVRVQGNKVTRILRTIPEENVMLGNTLPSVVPAEILGDNCLWDFFSIMRQHDTPMPTTKETPANA